MYHTPLSINVQIYFSQISWNFDEKTTFEEFEEICEQMSKNKKINIMMKKKQFASNIDSLSYF